MRLLLATFIASILAFIVGVVAIVVKGLRWHR